MHFELQPTHLENEFVRLNPLTKNDFGKLYKVASDPLIWEQHPNPNRYQKNEFQNYFTGAMVSGGAFLIYDNITSEPIGSSRFYDQNPEERSIFIGYTFLDRDHWGSTYNPAVKSLMLDHAFKFVDKVMFHIGSQNIRSQKAIEKLGAKKTSEIDVEYYGEPKRLNYTYQLNKEEWKVPARSKMDS